MQRLRSVGIPSTSSFRPAASQRSTVMHVFRVVRAYVNIFRSLGNETSGGSELQETRAVTG